MPPESDLAGLLGDTRRFIRRYVVMNDRQADAIALWIFHTHTFDAAESTPYVHVTSAERESGRPGSSNASSLSSHGR